MQESESVTRQLAELGQSVTFESIPGDVVRRLKFFVLDWLGVALSGAGTDLAASVRRIATAGAGTGSSTVFGGGFPKVQSRDAALANGAASHALDFDDGSGTGGLPHAAVTIMPAVLALAEERDRGGPELFAAILAAQEVGVRVTRIMEPEHYAQGFHKMATTGTFCATAGTARLLGLDLHQWLMAFGIAGSQASGLKANFGTMTKPLHAGLTSSSGVLACLLAEQGFTAAPDIIEAKNGYARTMSPSPHLDRAGLPLGRPYVIEGTRFKFHAACAGTHSTIDALSALRRAEAFSADDVESLRVVTHPIQLDVCNIEQPATALEGKFSIRFTAALALLDRDTTEAGFSDAVVRDPLVTSLMSRVTVGALEGATTNDDTEVGLVLKDGRRLTRRHRFADHRLTIDEERDAVVLKFMRLTTPLLGASGAREVVRLTEDLDREPSVRAFVDAVTKLAVAGHGSAR